MLTLMNDVSALLAKGIDSTCTTIEVDQGDRFPALDEGDWFPITLVRGTSIERMKVVERDGNMLTVIRGDEGTNAYSWLAGDMCSITVTADAIREIQAANQQFDNLQQVLEMSLAEGVPVKTFGYYEMGDYGGGDYTVMLPDNVPAYINVDGYGNHALPNGNILVLTPRVAGEYDVHQYGAKGDVVDGQGTNDLPSIRAANAQAKAISARQTSTDWETMSGGCTKLGALNYGIRVSQEDVEGGMDCAIPISSRCGFKGAGRNLTYITCLDDFAAVPVIANEHHEEKGADDFIEIGDFQILGRSYHGVSCNASYGIKFNVSQSGYTRTDNFSRIYNIIIQNVNGTGGYFSGRGEQAIDNVQANQNHYGLVFWELVDSFISRCNAGGNWHAGITNFSTASCKFSMCKSYYNGSAHKESVESGITEQGKWANWFIYGDSWVSGRTTYSQCESQESAGSGWVIGNGGNLFINCLAADPKRASVGEDDKKPAHCVGFYLGSWMSWEQSMAMDNHFQNCHIAPNLTTNYSDLNNKSYMGDGAVYIEARSRDNTGNITISPRVWVNESLLGGQGVGDNPLLSVMGEVLNDATPPSQSIMFYKNELNGVRVYGNPVTERNHKVMDYKVVINDAVTDPVWIDPNVDSLLKGLTVGDSYQIDAYPYSLIGAGTGYSADIERKLTRPAARLDGNNGFATDRKLIDLDEGTIRFSFTVGDRDETSLQLRTLLHQGDGTDTELFISLFNEYNLRINVGGNQIDGLGAGKKFKNSTWEVVIYPTGIELYSDGVKQSAHDTFVRGDFRSNQAQTTTTFGLPQPNDSSTLGMMGQMLGFSSDVATIIFDVNGANQSVVDGELDTVVTEVGDFTDAWEEVDLVV